ncbi:hypothetical protein Syun_027991 [Stephania yunnanensis]|uniref:Integrase catalytic domain-containing protein n=1 Tax=Stephania yunnanensis TaxID=152371 RepID=A0AAP0EJ13_9MAGN
MVCKSSTLSVIEKFLVFVKNQFQISVKALRTDNGTEFVYKVFAAFFSRLGILHQKSTPYSPQQNGVVERKHMHLLHITRALMFQSKLPKTFWGGALLAATFILNRLPSQVLGSSTLSYLVSEVSRLYRSLVFWLLVFCC